MATLAEATQEFHDAARALFWAAAEGLRLPQFVAWLSRRLAPKGGE